MKKYDITQPVRLKKGVYDLNSESNFNYQLNRVINWDAAELRMLRRLEARVDCPRRQGN